MTAFLKERGFVAGYGLMLAGVGLLLAGFAVDAWLHADDPHLAAEEGVFTLSNPGHLLVMIGLGVTIAGALLGPYSRWVLGRRPATVSIVVPVLALAIAFSVSGAVGVGISSISHDESAVAHTPTGTAATDAASHGSHLANVLPETSALLQLEESTFHEPANNEPVTRESLLFADTFLAQVKVATAKYKDVQEAYKDGYFQITQYLPLIGAHFFKPQNVGSLDPTQPGIILYEPDGNGGWRLTGLAYMMPKDPGSEAPPVTPLGGLAHWHYHTDLCFLYPNVTVAKSQADCGGLFVAETPWLLHVWAWKDSPEGVFNHANTLMQ